MNKDKLLELGLTEEQTNKVLELNKNFIPKYRYDEVASERDDLKDQIKDRDEQLKNLSQNAEVTDSLKKEIEDLKTKNKESKQEYEAKLEQVKKDNAIDNYLHNADVKNVGAVKKLLDLESVEFKDEKLSGLDKQLESLKEDESLSSLFNRSESFQNPLRGQDPRNSNQENKPKGIFEELRDLESKQEAENNGYNPWG